MFPPQSYITPERNGKTVKNVFFSNLGSSYNLHKLKRGDTSSSAWDASVEVKFMLLVVFALFPGS